MEESYMWGIGFLVMGISQLIYGGVLITDTIASEGEIQYIS
jgi:hypothetical protein